MAGSMSGIHLKGFAIFLLLAVFATSADAKTKKPSFPYGGGATYGEGGNYTGFGLRNNFYARTCPKAESIVTAAVTAAFNADNSIIAGLIRLFFHDCFVRGCDASVLLDGPDVEKLGPPNINSLRGIEVIDAAKASIEKICPLVVSCADIVSYAARDSIVLGGGRIPFNLWLGGRKDGDTSLLAETLTELPAPFATYAQLVEAFKKKNLNEQEMVILSAAHTVGRAKCGIINSRLYNFQGTQQADPTIDPTYLPQLRAACPQNALSNTVNMDMTTPTKVDTNYISDVLKGRGLFESDNALRTNPTGVRTLNFLNNQRTFSPLFSLAMLKMGTIEVKTGNAGKIRAVCNTNAGAK